MPLNTTLYVVQDLIRHIIFYNLFCSCFVVQGLFDIYMFFIQHIYVPSRTYFLNDIFCSTTYHTKQHIFFSNIFCYSTYMTSTTHFFINMYISFQTTYMLLNLSDICMSCILEQHICDPYVTYSCILPHPSRLSWRLGRPISTVER